MSLTDLRLSQGCGDDSKLDLAYACWGCISIGNFHCRQRCTLKNRVLTEMNECHGTKPQTSFSLWPSTSAFLSGLDAALPYFGSACVHPRLSRRGIKIQGQENHLLGLQMYSEQSGSSQLHLSLVKSNRRNCKFFRATSSGLAQLAGKPQRWRFN